MEFIKHDDGAYSFVDELNNINAVGYRNIDLMIERIGTLYSNDIRDITHSARLFKHSNNDFITLNTIYAYKPCTHAFDLCCKKFIKKYGFRGHIPHKKFIKFCKKSKMQKYQPFSFLIKNDLISISTLEKYNIYCYN